MCEVVSITAGVLSGLSMLVFVAECANKLAAWWNRHWTDI